MAHTHPLLICLATGLVGAFATACNRDTDAPAQAETSAEVSISPSRVAIFANEVISDVAVTVDRTVIIADEEGSGLRAIGTISNQGEEALHGLELSLTVEQPEGVGIGGHLLQVYMASPIAGGQADAFVMDFPTLQSVEIGQDVTTRVTIIRKLAGPAPENAWLITGRLHDEPFQHRDDGKSSTEESQDAADTGAGAGLEEGMDGDEEPIAGVGG